MARGKGAAHRQVSSVSTAAFSTGHTGTTRCFSASPFMLPRGGLCLLKQQGRVWWGSQNLEEAKVFMAAPPAHSHICCLPGLQLAAVRSCLFKARLTVCWAELRDWLAASAAGDGFRFSALMLPGAPRATSQAVQWPHQSLALGTPERRDSAEGEHWDRCWIVPLHSLLLSRERLSLKMSNDTTLLKKTSNSVISGDLIVNLKLKQTTKHFSALRKEEIRAFISQHHDVEPFPLRKNKSLSPYLFLC